MRRRRCQSVAATLSAVLLALTLGVAGNAGDAAGSRTKSCCWPDHFQAWLGRFAGMPVGGSHGVFEEEFMVEFDFPNNRWGFWMRDYYVTSEYTQVIYVEDYNSNTLTLASYQGCIIVPLNATNSIKRACIPDDAEFMETQRMGEGPDSLLVDAWKWDIDHIWKGEKSKTRVNAAYFHDCQPHSEIAWWFAENFNFTTYVTFLEMNVGDGDESPFKDLNTLYKCKEAGYLPRTMDARPHTIMENLYFMQRIGGTTYDPATFRDDDEDET